MTETVIIYALFAFVIFLQLRVLSDLNEVRQFQIKSDENIHHSFKLLDVPYHDWSDQNKNKEG